MLLYTLPVPNCYCRRRENVMCGQRSDSFQPRGLLLHNGPSILPHDYAKSDWARSCIHSEFSLQEEPCHCTSCFEQQVRSSLSLSVFWGCYKNGGGEGRCVVSSACRLNLSGKGTCKPTQLIMKQTSKLSSVTCKVRIRSQQSNSSLLSPDKRARARAHIQIFYGTFYFQTFHTHTFVSVHSTFVLMILFFIHFTLAKVQREKSKGVIVVPHWPTQTWWPLLLRLMTQPQVRLPSRPQVLTLPQDPSQQHPLRTHLILLACAVSGTDSAKRDFQVPQLT